MRKRSFFEEEEHIEVSLTPLIDTVFVLLIIFIIMSVAQKEGIVPVALPSAASMLAQPVDNKYFLLAVDQYKNIFLPEKKKVNLKELSLLIKSYCNSKKASYEAIIFADKDLFLEEVVTIIDLLYQLGMQKVYIKTKKIENLK